MMWDLCKLDHLKVAPVPDEAHRQPTEQVYFKWFSHNNKSVCYQENISTPVEFILLCARHLWEELQ